MTKTKSIRTKKKLRKWWVNIYPAHAGDLHETRKRADFVAKWGGCKPIECIQVVEARKKK